MCNMEALRNLEDALFEFTRPKKSYDDLNRNERECLKLCQALFLSLERLKRNGANSELEEKELDLAEQFEAMALLANTGLLQKVISTKNMEIMKKIFSGIQIQGESLAAQALRKKNEAVFVGKDADIDLLEDDRQKIEKLKKKIEG